MRFRYFSIVQARSRSRPFPSCSLVQARFRPFSPLVLTSFRSRSISQVRSCPRPFPLLTRSGSFLVLAHFRSLSFRSVSVLPRSRSPVRFCFLARPDSFPFSLTRSVRLVPGERGWYSFLFPLVPSHSCSHSSRFVPVLRSCAGLIVPIVFQKLRQIYCDNEFWDPGNCLRQTSQVILSGVNLLVTNVLFWLTWQHLPGVITWVFPGT